MSAVDTPQVAPAVAASPVAGSVKSTGAQLVAAFPPRPVAASWPATEARRSAVAGPGAGGAVRVGQPEQPTQPAIGGAGGAGLAACAARRQLAAAVARQRRRGPTGLAAVGRHRPRQAAAAPDLGAVGADLRRCDPAQPGLAAAVRPGAAQPGRRDGPHPRSGARSPSSPRCVRAGSDCKASSRR